MKRLGILICLALLGLFDLFLVIQRFHYGLGSEIVTENGVWKEKPVSFSFIDFIFFLLFVLLHLLLVRAFVRNRNRSRA